VLSLLADEVLPTALTVNNSRANNPKIIIVNSGALRFDIFAGRFTKNDQLTTSPFDDAFLYIPGVPLNVAKGVLPKLNNKTVNNKREVSRHTEHARTAERYGRGDVEAVYGRWLAEMHSRAGPERRAAKNLTLGYVTHDVVTDFFFPVSHAYMVLRRPVREWATTLYTRRCHSLHRQITLALPHQRAKMTTRRSTSFL